MPDRALPKPHWRLYLGIFAVWLFAGVLITSSGASIRASRSFIDIGYVLLPLAGALASLRRALIHQDIRRLGWTLFTFAFLSWSFGGLVWVYYEIVRNVSPPYPSVADAGFIGFAALSAVGLATLMRQWSPRLSVPEFLDVLFIGIATTFTIYALVLDQAFGQVDAAGWTLLTTLAYPAADVAVLTVAVFTASRAPPGRRAQPLLLAGGLALIAITDTVWIYLTAVGVYRSGTPFDLLWHVAFALVICGVIYRQVDTQLRRREDVAAVATWTPAILTGPVVIAALYEQFVHGGLDVLGVSLVSALFVLMVSRQTLALLQNERLRRQVQTTNERLVEAAAFRTQFINATAHELSNPLTPLKIHASLLSEPTYAESKENRAATAAIINRSIERLIRLVDDLLDLARIESGKFSIRAEPVDLSRVAHETAQLYASTAKEKAVRIEVDAPAIAPVVTDPQRVAQILGNFVSNAIKYTPPEQTAGIFVTDSTGSVKVGVRDSGLGLTSEQRSQLFRPFAQVHVQGEQQKGTGLGLYICAALAQRLGGEVGVDSDGRGRGSTFWLRLPKGPAAPRGGS